MPDDDQIQPSTNVRPVGIESEMRTSYLDYAMSVIVSRALPDVRDGLKPVQRRILWGMYDGGARPGTQYRKSARIVGDVMGRYHPHGDQAVYDALVRMAQDFSMRYPLVDGQGNFGSVDGDPPAAQRYTEARMAAIADELLADIDQNTVNFEPNYDGSTTQPNPLPARIPNLLANGSSGIAVGMATNIPPHNLTEICDAVTMLVDNPEATLEDLLTVVKGPDFPTHGIALVGKNSEQVRLAYGEGHGRITMHARTSVEESTRGRTAMIVTELPYQVNKAQLIEKIADLVRDGKIAGIADLRDESDRNGMRIVIELKREGSVATIKNLLYKHTAMRSTFSVNMMAIVDGQPRRLGLKRALELFIAHRHEVIRRRTEYQLEKAREREHILEGLIRAIDLVDLIIATIRAAESGENARALLQGTGVVLQQRLPTGTSAAVTRQLVTTNPFTFSEIQARAILELQLRRLAALERQQLQDEYEELIKRIAYLEDLLANPRKIDLLIKEDAAEVRKKFGDARRTEIVEADAEDFKEEDLVPHQECVLTFSNRNYIKRMPLDEFRVQHRGGRGSRGAQIREEDAVMKLVVCDSHDNLLFFTDKGKVYHLRAYDVPDLKKQSKGTPVVNLIDMEAGERVTAIVAVRDYARDFMLLATHNGVIKKTKLSEFAEVRRNGKKAMRLDEGDQLIAARIATDETHVILVSSEGQAIRFKIDDLRDASRESGGVRGMRLGKNAYVVAVESAEDGPDILIISERGFGKRTPIEEYPLQGRGGQGVRTLNITDRTGVLAACRVVDPRQQLMLVSRDGIVIRTRVDTISRIGRNTQGVAVFNVAEGDQVASIATFWLEADRNPSPDPELAASANGQGGLPLN
ncbi:MAG: DNA gyrase subunit A [Dehalococcoidia bacterium]|nr:DNA gyrase subunit A [Dehalococcoidia bacterium]MCB9485134.1 DNA gyrase subunit A [Thermoflexaceae bacterium]